VKEREKKKKKIATGWFVENNAWGAFATAQIS
jgi:hypothetical protein